MARPRSLVQAVELRTALRKRPKFTSVAERLVILAALIYADLIVETWWARVVFSLVAFVALFNVVGVALLAHRRSRTKTRSHQGAG